MNIKQAKICLDCDEIYGAELSHCPMCGGRVSWFLKDWIGAIQEEHGSVFHSNSLQPFYAKSR